MESRTVGNSRGMSAQEKLAIAKAAMSQLPALIRSHGTYHAATATQPAIWLAERGSWLLAMVEGFRRLPTDPGASTIVDISAKPSGKVFSVSWIPELPDVAPHIACCMQGAWLDALGLNAAVGAEVATRAKVPKRRDITQHEGDVLLVADRGIEFSGKLFRAMRESNGMLEILYTSSSAFPSNSEPTRCISQADADLLKRHGIEMAMRTLKIDRALRKKR